MHRILSIAQHRIVLTTIFLGAFYSTSLKSAPSNNNLSNAIALSGVFDSSSGSTIGATRQSGEKTTSGYSTVWYKWSPSSNGRARFSVLPTDNDFQRCRLTVWIGAGSPGVHQLTLLGASEEYQGETSLLNLPVFRSSTYYICVAHYADDSYNQGNYDLSVVLSTGSDLNSLNVSGAAVSGTFNFAFPLTGNNSTGISYSLEANLREAGEPQINPNYSNWWRWTAAENGKAKVSLAGSELGKYYDHWEDKTLLVYEVESFAEMIQSDPIAGSLVEYGLPSNVSFNVRAGKTYFICAGVGRLTQYGFRGGQDSSGLAWKIMTLQFSTINYAAIASVQSQLTRTKRAIKKAQKKQNVKETKRLRKKYSHLQITLRRLLS